jgi:hypothetical protein
MRNSGLQLDTIIRIVDVDQIPGAVDWRGRWGDFIATTDLSNSEIDDVAVDLVTRGEAIIGGGAAPISRIVVETPAPRIAVWGLAHAGQIRIDTLGGAPISDLHAFRIVNDLVTSGLNCSLLVLHDGEAIWQGATLPIGPKDLGLTTAVVTQLLKGRTAPAAA